METNNNNGKVIEFIAWLIIRLFLVFIIFSVQLFSRYNAIYVKLLLPDYGWIFIAPLLFFLYLIFVIVQLFGIFRIIVINLDLL